MSKVSLTLTFDSLDELRDHLNATARDPRQAVINFADRPDVGVSADALPTLPEACKNVAAAAAAFNPFAGAAVAQVPPSPAPSTAAAEAPPTAPAAPTSSATAPAPSVPAPPTAPAATAPAAPATPTTLAGIEVDADGLPWDARIHAGGRAKNADGRWRQKRSLNDAALKNRVEAELRQALGAAASVPVPLPPPAPSVPGTSGSPAIPSPPGVPTVPTPAASTTAVEAEETAPSFLARIGGMLASGALTQDKLAAALSAAGLTSMSQLITAPVMVPVVRAHL